MEKKKTYELVSLLTEAINMGNQELINMYAYELATRLYVPNTGYTFEEILDGFGYRKIEKDDKQITIEEYMRGRQKDE